jgi:hypothetical protein
MKRFHSASDSMITYIQNYAKKYDKRKKEHHIVLKSLDIELLQEKILELENKIIQYEKRRAEDLCKVLEILSPKNEIIKIEPIYQKLKIAQ